jgi:hypothetical protein
VPGEGGPKLGLGCTHNAEGPANLHRSHENKCERVGKWEKRVPTVRVPFLGCLPGGCKYVSMFGKDDACCLEWQEPGRSKPVVARFIVIGTERRERTLFFLFIALAFGAITHAHPRTPREGVVALCLLAQCSTVQDSEWGGSSGMAVGRSWCEIGGWATADRSQETGIWAGLGKAM